MAIVRPKIRVEQQFANPTVTITSPLLNAVIVGPAYNLQDYTTANKANIAVSGYGDLLAASSTADGSPVGLPAAATIAFSVAEPPNNTVGALLDSASVRVFLENVYADIHHAATAISMTDNSTTFTDAAATFVTTGVLPGDRLVVTDIAGGTTITRTVLSVTSETVLEMTANFIAASGTDINGTVYASFGTASNSYRIERKLADSQLSASFLAVAGQNTDILGGATALIGSSAHSINSADVFLEYRSLRQDLATLTTIDANSVDATLGTLDERNPLAVGAHCALGNTKTSIQVYGLTGDNLNGSSDLISSYTSAANALALRNDVYAIVPLSSDSGVISLLKDHAVGLSVPDKSKFRSVIGSGSLPATKLLSPVSTGETEIDAADPVDVLVDVGAAFITNGAAVGDVITVTASSASANIALGAYTIRRVISEDIVQIDTTFAAAGSTTLDYTVTHAATTLVTRAGAASSSRAAINVLLDNSASFITSGVIAGDYVSVSSGTYVISSVLSENRVKIVGTEGELTSVGGAVTANASYSISRTLDRAGQVTELSAVPGVYASKRLIMVWPDSVRVSGVTDGLTGLQNPLPGYFAAACVGGMIAGNPPHQNFSSLSILGLDSVSDSAGYFTDTQVDQLSASGWYVIVQDTPSSLPYAVHSVTTDVSTLDLSESMITKNYDYVALFYRDLLKPFLKGYNITDNTLNLIQDAFDQGTTELKSQLLPKIGAPIISSTLSKVEVLATSVDQVRLEAAVLLPRMLNVMTLVLVA